MDPQGSPHWDRIVAGDWPRLSPTQWRELETAARELAAGLADGDAERARKAFDEAAPGVALAAVHREMATHRDNSAALGAALGAVADFFGACAEAVARARHAILDAVEDAQRRIDELGATAAPRPAAAPQPGVVEPEGDDEREAQAPATADSHDARVEQILAEARDRVADISAAAAAEVPTMARPHHNRVAQLLPAAFVPHDMRDSPSQLAPWDVHVSVPRPEAAEAVSRAGMTESVTEPAAGGERPGGGVPFVAGAATPGGGARPLRVSTENSAPQPASSASGLRRPLPIPGVAAPRGRDAPVPTVRAEVAGALRAAQAPAFVVGAKVDADLVLARTLLGGMVHALWRRPPRRQASVTLAMAAAVLRGPGGAHAFVTSNEGRGWLPAGLWLPSEVTLPWTLGVDRPEWEAIADPARALVEFAAAWAPRSGARLVALASSRAVPSRLRTALGDIGIAEAVGGDDESLDLTAPRAGFVDRLAAAGMESPTSDLPMAAHGRELAAATHRRAVLCGGTELATAITEVESARALRAAILDALAAGGEVAPHLWAQLWDADALLESELDYRRVDLQQVDIGDVRLDAAELATLRGLLAERRADELLFHLSDPTVDRQSFRDIAYAHSQLRPDPEEFEAILRVSVSPPVAGKERKSKG